MHLAQPVGKVQPPSGVTMSFTAGPVDVNTLQPLVVSSGTGVVGSTTGWWAQWSGTVQNGIQQSGTGTLQDYRGFGPVHGGVCNILMADGSVQSFADANGDHYLNPGFPATAGGGIFSDATVELTPGDLYSRWSLN